MNLKVGFLGGTFDPIHNGHLAMARAAARNCGLRRIYFVPAAQPWHKRPPRASFADRYAMTALALQRHTDWVPLAIPDRGNATYTVEQLAWLDRHRPGERVHLILGADAFATLPTWKNYRRLFSLCDFIVLARRGFRRDDILALAPLAGAGSRLTTGRHLYWLAQFDSAISSTELRHSLAAPRPNRSALPAPVVTYARRAGLYQ